MSEALVIGGGLAGAAVATLLATEGRRVHLVEREAEPGDKVCGEFLSLESQRMLSRLGLDLDRLGASRIDRLSITSGKRAIDVPLPFVARGLGRKRLDAALLAQAAAAGVRVDRGVTVRSISAAQVETSGGSIGSGLRLLASGKHDVRGAARVTDGCETGYVGFKMHLRLPPGATAKLSNRVMVTLFDGGYAGLQLVEERVANLCLLIDKPRLSAMDNSWPTLFECLLREPVLGAILAEAEPLWAKPLAISAVPYGYLQANDMSDAFYRLGDQAAVIPSFCGEGMAIALHSAFRAAALIEAGASPADHRRVLRRDLAGRLRLAMRLQRHGRSEWSRPLLWAGLRLMPSLAHKFVQRTRVPAII